MTKAITTPKRAGLDRVYWEPQTAFGTLASFGALTQVIFGRLTVDRGVILHSPAGGGSNWDRAETVKAGELPKWSLDCALTRSNLRLLEFFFSRAPTVSNAQLTEANDGGAQLDTWSLAGVRPGLNTAWAEASGVLGSAIIYVSLTNSGTTRTVTLYRDSARTLSVATGSRSGDGSITLAATNSSGLSGSVVVTYSGDDTDITLTINTIDFDAGAIAEIGRYFSLGRTYAGLSGGDELKDCIVTKASIRSQSQQGARLLLEGLASTRSAPGYTATTVPGDLDVYIHEHLSASRDPGGTPAEVATDEVLLELENIITPVFGGSTTPIAFVRHGQAFRGRVTAQYGTEAANLLSQAAAVTWEDFEAEWLASSKALNLTFDQVLWEAVNEPAAGREKVEPVEASFRATQATGASPANPLSVTWQP